MRNNRLEELYFIIPEHLIEVRKQHVIRESSERFMLDVYSGDHAQKIRRYHTEGDLLLEEMKYVANLQVSVSPKAASEWKQTLVLKAGLVLSSKSASEWKQTLALNGQARFQLEINI